MLFEAFCLWFCVGVSTVCIHWDPENNKQLEEIPKTASLGVPEQDKEKVNKNESNKENIPPRLQKKENRDKIPDPGDIVVSTICNYELKHKIGGGAMGHVFLTKSGRRSVALKAEKYSKSMLSIEVRVLKATAIARCRHFCRLFDYGSQNREFTYLVTTLLGKDLYRLRCEQPGRKFSINTVTKIGLHTLEAIQELHDCGFISRDVKPSNFAPGDPNSNHSQVIYMFDFGISRQYVDKYGKVLASRGAVGWRGTMRYGSLNAHKKADLGRFDDIESWLYMMIELTVGVLPWSTFSDRQLTWDAKKRGRTEDRTQLFGNSPRVWVTVYKHSGRMVNFSYQKMLDQIDQGDFHGIPDYDKFRGYLVNVRYKYGCHDHARYDWELDESETMIEDEVLQPESVFGNHQQQEEQSNRMFTEGKRNFQSAAVVQCVYTVITVIIFNNFA